MQNFTSVIKQNNIDSLETEALENIANKFPFFQLNKTLLLKRYYEQQHFKYNNTLKNVAAHTVNREILFDYINTITEEKSNQENTIEKVTEAKTLLETETTINDSVKIDEPEITEIESFVNEITEDKPIIEKNSTTEELATETTDVFHFTNNEKHSFNQWLQLSGPEPIKRKLKNTKTNNPKLNIIDRFINNNPKISPIKKSATTSNTSLSKNNSNISNELMTETLAKVYVAQKKFENAIQAYKILSLKYPEKSGLFADQIQRIKILQNHKS